MSKKKPSLLPYILVLCAIAVAGLAATQLPLGAKSSEQTTESTQQTAALGQTTDDALAIPRLTINRPEQIISHTCYTIGFNPDWNIPNWVAYCLTGEHTQGEAKRADSFSPDPQISRGAVIHKDYSNSGYDRGHMAAAADFKFSQQAMNETFYTTNICPQNQNLNRGDWNDLEELVRKLAVKHNAIYVCCGPIVTDTRTTIGQQHTVVVPQAFYKVLLRPVADGYAAIGFVFANEAGSKPLMTYAKTVDEVEQLTGIDFFPSLPDDIEAKAEADYDFAQWSLSR